MYIPALVKVGYLVRAQCCPALCDMAGMRLHKFQRCQFGNVTEITDDTLWQHRFAVCPVGKLFIVTQHSFGDVGDVSWRQMVP